MNARLLTVTGMLAMSLAGCKFDLGLKEASDNIVVASENIHKATKDLDPIQLRRLMDENSTMRDQLMQVAKTYQTAMGAGALVVSQQALYWRVIDYSGAVRVVMKLNSGGASSLVINDSELANRSATLGFNAREFLWPPVTSEATPVNLVPGGWNRGIEDRLQARVDGLFASVMTGQPAPPALAPKEIWLNPRFPETGLHAVVVEVTPRALSTAGDRKSVV